MYISQKTELSKVKYLSSLSQMLTSDEVTLFYESNEEISRVGFDGVFTLIGEINGQKVGVILTDFRVSGGSFSKKNSSRASAFVHLLGDLKLPLIFLLSSLGVRFTEGRTVFDPAFSIISDLYYFRKNNLLITASIGQTLGISALFFGQGHYRIALEGETQINLTGPEVHKKFFVDQKEDFADFTSGEHQFQVNTLVHEVLPTTDAIYFKLRQMISYMFTSSTDATDLYGKVISDIEQGGLMLRENETNKLSNLKNQLGESILELFSQRSPIVRIYIAKIEGKRIGYLLNPPSHPNNLLTVGSIDKASAAMEIFRVLKLPLVSILDTPGGDPRKQESDKDAIVKMVHLAHQMIEYPHRKIGMILGRCFGGAAMFGFPKIFDGRPTIAVKDAQIGVMHKSIIDGLLDGAPRLKEKWREVSQSETATFDDLIACGTIGKVIESNQIRMEMSKFLATARTNTEIEHKVIGVNVGSGDVVA